MTDTTTHTPPAPAAPAAPAPAQKTAAAPPPDFPMPVLEGGATPLLAPNNMGVFGFTIHLKSNIKRGYHLGSSLYIVDTDPNTALGKVQSFYGSDLQTLIGPMTLLTGVQLL